MGAHNLLAFAVIEVSPGCDLGGQQTHIPPRKGIFREEEREEGILLEEWSRW